MLLYLGRVALPFHAFSSMLDGIARSQIFLGLMSHSLLRPILILALIAGLAAIGLPVDATVAMGALR